MQSKQGSMMDLEAFRRGAEEQFADVGFIAQVKPYQTSEGGTYAFDVDITGRTEVKEFDFDRQVHEVVNNLLELPGQDKGYIKTDAGAIRDANPGATKGHGPGCMS